MADIVVNLETCNSDDLINQGIKAFNLRDFDTAVAALSRAVELLAAEHGDKHDSLGTAYFYYGKALLEIHREEVEPLGDAVPREIDNDSGDDVLVEPSTSPKTSKTDENVCSEEDLTVADKSSEESSSKGDNEIATNGADASEHLSNSEVQHTSTNETAEEEPSDLQVAWEVLELAKIIFDERGESGKKELSETLILLGEVSLESENFASAVEDIKRGLEIQNTIVESDSRTLAETYYKLAVALSTNNEIDEAIKHFNISLEILKNKVTNLKNNAEANSAEIKEIEDLIPEIEEKIADMKNFIEETTTRIVEAMQAKPMSNGPFDAGTSTSTINDISHLIKRKRKAEEEDGDGQAAKRVSE